jgi:hypothetical protein
MDITPFTKAVDTIGAETGLRLWLVSPGVPEFTLPLGPFPAVLRVGFDIDPAAGLVPEIVLDIAVGDTDSRWAVFEAWERAPRAAMAEHGLPGPLPRADLTFGDGATAGIAYRVPLQAFGTGIALQLLHAGAAFASFMARDLAPAMPGQNRARLARHGIEPGLSVPFPAELLASGRVPVTA